MQMRAPMNLNYTTPDNYTNIFPDLYLDTISMPLSEILLEDYFRIDKNNDYSGK